MAFAHLFLYVLVVMYKVLVHRRYSNFSCVFHPFF